MCNGSEDRAIQLANSSVCGLTLDVAGSLGRLEEARIGRVVLPMLEKTA